ncbi:uncharacterized protein V6R79_012272 [Siganus canaliculatus]
MSNKEMVSTETENKGPRKVFLPNKLLECLPRLPALPSERLRWNTNEEIASYLISFDRHEEWLSCSLKTRPRNGSIILYNRKKVKYRKDGYCWKKRKDGKTTREDHMKLKVQGMECLYGCYVHSSIVPTFHRRCYWLLQNPDIVLVHYLNVPSLEDSGKCSPLLCALSDRHDSVRWSRDDLLSQLRPMFHSMKCSLGSGDFSIEDLVQHVLDRQRTKPQPRTHTCLCDTSQGLNIPHRCNSTRHRIISPKLPPPSPSPSCRPPAEGEGGRGGGDAGLPLLQTQSPASSPCPASSSASSPPQPHRAPGAVGNHGNGFYDHRANLAAVALPQNAVIVMATTPAAGEEAGPGGRSLSLARSAQLLLSPALPPAPGKPASPSPPSSSSSPTPPSLPPPGPAPMQAPGVATLSLTLLPSPVIGGLLLTPSSSSNASSSSICSPAPPPAAASPSSPPSSPHASSLLPPAFDPDSFLNSPKQGQTYGGPPSSSTPSPVVCSSSPLSPPPLALYLSPTSTPPSSVSPPSSLSSSSSEAHRRDSALLPPSSSLPPSLSLSPSSSSAVAPPLLPLCLELGGLGEAEGGREEDEQAKDHSGNHGDDDDDDEGRAPPLKQALLQTSHAPSTPSPQQQTGSSSASLLLICQDSVSPHSQPANQTQPEAEEAPPLAQVSHQTLASDHTPAAVAMDTSVQVKEEGGRDYDAEDACMDTPLEEEEEAEPCREGAELDISFDSQFPDLISDLITEETGHAPRAVFPPGVRYVVPPQPSPSSSFLPFPHPLPSSSSSTRLASITDFSPEWSYPEGGVKVLITGPWSGSGRFSCVFDQSRVPASLIQPGVLRCYCPGTAPPAGPCCTLLHPAGPRCTLLVHAAPCWSSWSTLHPAGPRCTLLVHAAPCWSSWSTLHPAGPRCTLLVHAAPCWSSWSTLHPGGPAGPAGPRCTLVVLLVHAGPRCNLVVLLVQLVHAAPWWSCWSSWSTLHPGGPAGPRWSTLQPGGPAGPAGPRCTLVVLLVQLVHAAPWWSCWSSWSTLHPGGPAGPAGPRCTLLVLVVQLVQLVQELTAACVSPAHKAGLVSLQVLDSGGLLSSSVLFEYRARNASSLPSSQLDWLSLDDNQFRMSILERLEQMERRMAEMAAHGNHGNHGNHQQRQHGRQLATPPPPRPPDDSLQSSQWFERRIVAVCERMISGGRWGGAGGGGGGGGGGSERLYHSVRHRGMTLLHLAAAQGYTHLIHTLIHWRTVDRDSLDLEQEVDPLNIDHFSCTPLMWACALGHQRAAELLYGWNSSALGIPDSLGRLPLAVARSRGHTRLAAALEELHMLSQTPPSPLSTSPDTGLSSSSSLPSPSSPSPSSAYSSGPAPMDTSPSSPSSLSSSSSSLPVSPPSPSSHPPPPPVSVWGEEPCSGLSSGDTGLVPAASLHLMDYESAAPPSPGHAHRAHLAATLEEQLLSFSENAENEGEEEYLEEEVLQVDMATLAEQIIEATPERIKQEDFPRGAESPLRERQENPPIQDTWLATYLDTVDAHSQSPPRRVCPPSPLSALALQRLRPPSSVAWAEFLNASANGKMERDFALLTLTDGEQRELYEAARIIQTAFRRYKGRRLKEQQDMAAAVIQRCYRKYKQYALYKKMTQAAILIQSKFRSYYEQKRFQQSRRAAVLIQQYYRSYKEYERLKQAPRGATPPKLKGSFLTKKQDQAARKIMRFLRRCRHRIKELKQTRELERRGLTT